jgi:polyketide biosynthesis acyl carrier protein
MSEAMILDVLRRTVVSVVPQIDPADVTAGRTLAELGCNSVDRADIVTLAMEELGVTVPVTELGGDRDVRALVELFAAHR